MGNFGFQKCGTTAHLVHNAQGPSEEWLVLLLSSWWQEKRSATTFVMEVWLCMCWMEVQRPIGGTVLRSDAYRSNRLFIPGLEHLNLSFMIELKTAFKGFPNGHPARLWLDTDLLSFSRWLHHVLSEKKRQNIILKSSSFSLNCIL